ncbi:MAG: universal stress protein [Chloroflexota bacterium]
MPVEKILVPVQGNSCDDEVLRLAGEIAKGSKAKVHALYIIKVKRDLPLDAEISQETSKAEKVLHHLEQLGRERKCSLEATLLQARDVGPAVVQEAVERRVDLIVMQMPYKKRFGSFTLGDTIPYILKNAPCRVILCREAMTLKTNNGPARG